MVTAYGRILPPDVLDAPRRGCLNVHASLLPRWRGAAPIQWAIASGDTETGVCLMQMEAGLDTGPVLATRREPIRPTDTSASLHARLAELGGALLREALPRFLAGRAACRPAAGDGRHPRPDGGEGRRAAGLDPTGGRAGAAGAGLHPLARVAGPCWTARWSRCLPPRSRRAAVRRGRCWPREGVLEVACGEGALRLLEVQPEGRRRMSAPEFLSGHPAPAGRPALRRGAGMNVLVLHGPTLSFRQDLGEVDRRLAERARALGHVLRTVQTPPRGHAGGRAVGAAGLGAGRAAQSRPAGSRLPRAPAKRWPRGRCRWWRC